MAKAPRPGVGKRKDRSKATRISFEMTVRGETRHVVPFNLSSKIAYQLQLDTDRPVTWHVNQLRHGSSASLAALWWAAGRESGVTGEKFFEVLDDLMSLDADQFELTEITDEDATAEAASPES